jgi:hypothetical protein
MFGEAYIVVRCRDDGAVERLTEIIHAPEEAAAQAELMDAAVKGLGARTAVVPLRLVPAGMYFTEREEEGPAPYADLENASVCGHPWPAPGGAWPDAVKALMHPGHLDWLSTAAAEALSIPDGVLEQPQVAEPEASALPIQAELAEAAG